MLLTSILTVVLASLARTTFAQDQFGPIVYDSIHNATSIYGTWSSGGKAVLTGPGFADPANMTFTYPKTTGISYSFTEDGFYEISRYRFNSNGSEPTCITGVIVWVHGTYTLNANGSISMTPLGDGFQQVQDPCAAVSNFIQLYNQTEYYKGWRIFHDPNQGYKLHMFAFDGSPLAPQFQVSTTPNMLPTKQLRNVPPATNSRRSLDVEERSVSGAQDVLGPHWLTGVMVVAGGLALLMSSTAMLL
ncbi:chaperone for protein-folding within the ER, fungal-domain-containing protein [Gymnopilus junonius]|uniref:Protein ROT1 n=1 Tax=Gymnopilus junonius TaxID=109634 RepID=A0A9P5N9V6_GYMJU|nr:chaperone for protein-folding within the ER, fungal-domain-containing protein [Gymnopilus junonius]